MLEPKVCQILYVAGTIAFISDFSSHSKRDFQEKNWHLKTKWIIRLCTNLIIITYL